MDNHQLIVHDQLKSPIAEAYRTLRTNIQFSKRDSELKAVMFTSTGPAEGKSTTAANTAIALAQSGKKIIIADCDFRKPVLHHIFSKPNRGFTNALVEDTPLKSLIQETKVPNLHLLTSGPIPPNPSELLGSSRMLSLFEDLKSQYDYVILDTPPIVAVTDGCVLASRVDGVIMVIAAGMVRPEMAQHAKDLILKANGKLLGVVLNRVEVLEEYSYYYYYYGEECQNKKQRQSR
ncbi:MAG TPA: capsular biosynthesis protein [Firmicutes bacterium]|nr:capsular biosynthesis protein [Bacillota bacterium]